MALCNTHKIRKIVQSDTGDFEVNCCDNPTYFSAEECECCADCTDLDALITYAKAQGWIP